MPAIDTISDKQFQAIVDSTATLNIYHGAVRGGKTMSQIAAFLDRLKTGPPGRVGIIGKTQQSVGKNIGDELAHLVGSRAMDLKLDKVTIFGRECEIFGANTEKSKDTIQGATFALVLGDETSLWPENMFEMVNTRMSLPGSRGFFTANPAGPKHWLKAKWIDNDRLKAAGDLAEFHFTLDDNPGLGERFKNRLKLAHSGVFYQRYILGLWVMAEGLIYEMFSDQAPVVVDVVPKGGQNWLDFWVGVDYGTKNDTVFLLVGLAKDGHLYVCREYRHSGREGKVKTDQEYSDDLGRWLKEMGRELGVGEIIPHYIFIDPSAASFRQQVWRDRKKHPPLAKVAPANNDVDNGIRRVRSLLNIGGLHIYQGCDGLREELTKYIWDPKAAERNEEKPRKEFDHGPDALRYVANGLGRVFDQVLREVA